MAFTKLAIKQPVNSIKLKVITIKRNSEENVFENKCRDKKQDPIEEPTP